MSITDYIKLIIKKIRLIVGFSILIALASFVWIQRLPPSHEVTMTITVAKAGTSSDSQVFNYDDYYNLQSTGLITDMLAGWFASPSVTKEIFERAHLALPGRTVKQLSRIFLHQKIAPTSGVLTVSVKIGSASDGERLMQSAREVVDAKIAEYKKKTKFANDFQLMFTDPVVLEQQANPVLYTLANGVAAFILAVLGVILLEYIKA